MAAASSRTRGGSGPRRPTRKLIFRVPSRAGCRSGGCTMYTRPTLASAGPASMRREFSHANHSMPMKVACRDRPPPRLARRRHCWRAAIPTPRPGYLPLVEGPFRGRSDKTARTPTVAGRPAGSRKRPGRSSATVRGARRGRRRWRCRPLRCPRGCVPMIRGGCVPRRLAESAGCCGKQFYSKAAFHGRDVLRHHVSGPMRICRPARPQRRPSEVRAFYNDCGRSKLSIVAIPSEGTHWVILITMRRFWQLHRTRDPK